MEYYLGGEGFADAWGWTRRRLVERDARCAGDAAHLMRKLFVPVLEHKGAWVMSCSAMEESVVDRPGRRPRFM